MWLHNINQNKEDLDHIKRETQRFVTLHKDIILSFRDKWNIPKDGVKDIIEFLKWNRLHLGKDTKDFEKDIEIEIPKKANSVTAYWVSELVATEKTEIYKGFLFDKSLIEDFNKILKKFNIPQYAERFLLTYIFYSRVDIDMTKKWQFYSDNLSIEFDDENSEVSIKIKNTVGLNEFKQNLNVIKNYFDLGPNWQLSQKTKKPRKRKYPKFDRDKRIYELFIEGKNNEEIKNIIKKDFKDTIYYFDIARIVSRFKDLNF